MEVTLVLIPKQSWLNISRHVSWHGQLKTWLLAWGPMLWFCWPLSCRYVPGRTLMDTFEIHRWVGGCPRTIERESIRVHAIYDLYGFDNTSGREIHHAWPPIKHNISINVNSHISIHWNCEISWVIGLSYQTRIPILDMATSLPCSLVKELILFLSEVLAINPLACMQWDYGHAQLSRAGHLSEI